MSNWYQDNNLQSSEKVTLAEDIEITFSGDYPGKFYFPVVTIDASLKADKVLDQKMPAPRVTSPPGAPKLVTKPYVKSNYLTLTVPSYIVSQFEDVIPAGTEFMISSVGERYEIDHIKIISLV